MLVRHYEWAGYDVLAITDHWVRTVEPSTKKLLVIPSTELNAYAPTRSTTRTSWRSGSRSTPCCLEATSRRSQEVVDWIAENGGVPYLAHTYWSGLRTEQWEDCEGLYGIEVWNSGCELELGRGDSSIHWDEALEHGAPLLRARDRRLAPPRLRQRLRLDVGAREREDAGRRSSTRCGRACSTARPARRSATSRSATATSSSGAAPRRASRSTRPRARCSRECRPARLSEPLGGPRTRRRRPDHGRAARSALRARRMDASRCRPQRQQGLDEPLVDRLDALAGTRFDLLVIGAGSSAPGSPRPRARTASKVALVERGDFASATSSASSKLIHGGLRYLQMGDIRSCARRTRSGGH